LKVKKVDDVNLAFILFLRSASMEEEPRKPEGEGPPQPEGEDLPQAEGVEEDPRGDQEDDKPEAPAGRLDVQRVDSEGNKAEFLEACSNLNMRTIRSMVEEQGMDPSRATDSINQNCLHFVASSVSEAGGHGEAGLDAEQQTQAQLIGYLSSRGADPNCRRSRDGWTPLHVAAMLKRTALVRELLQAGASAEVKDNKGMTPEDWAEKYKLGEIQNILLHR